MPAKIITATGVIVALYFALHHGWSGAFVSGIVAVLAARWSELTLMRHTRRRVHVTRKAEG